MPPKRVADVSNDSSKTKKRKNPPPSSSDVVKNQIGRAKRSKIERSRTPLAQSTDNALKNGELDLQSFLKSRAFEIKALEDGMRGSKRSLHLRAFQSLPRDMRRRTASHNAKRVPKWIQARAKREQAQDNAPSVVSRKRKPSNSRGWLRAENEKRLEILACKTRASKASKGEGKDAGIITRGARLKQRTDKLNEPPIPKSKFRKRQIHKTWLPTHLWHVKRAIMTEPKKPLWRFAIPIKSTEKSYRPTHRAGGARGAVAWDVSYMSTIGLEGLQQSLEKVLRGLGVTDRKLWEQKNDKWIFGKRSWSGWLSREAKQERIQIGPSKILWCSSEENPPVDDTVPKKKRSLFIRIHPSIFLELWAEVLRLSKLQRPAVHATDLRFEIGSIEITGPGSTETLLGILHPYDETEDGPCGHEKSFKALAGITNSGSLPANSLLSFSIKDPRLQYPPRKVALPDPTNEESNLAMLEMLSAWPVDSTSPSPALFNRHMRFAATRLPSQKAINRRKALAPPGQYPSLIESDPRIPIMLLASTRVQASSAHGSWTLLAPWKCILPIWYGLVHYPLSSGGNPRFGGLQELRQIHFEHGVPWFPADYPGTVAGDAWHTDENKRRKAEWERRPKGKRIEWDSLDLGTKRKGEVGLGWACDFEKLCTTETDMPVKSTREPIEQASSASPSMQHVLEMEFSSLLSSADAQLPPPTVLATVRLTLVTRGVVGPCARIYRLPSTDSTLDFDAPSSKQQWRALLPALSHFKAPTNPGSKAKQYGRIPLNTPLPQRIQLLAQSLLQPSLPYPAVEPEENGYPSVPGEEDLVGFVTTGDFNLAKGKGVAVGSVMAAKTIEGLRRDGKEERLFIVRNAGEKVGRLARWEPV